MSSPGAPDGFLSRWSRRKVGARQGAPEASPQPVPSEPVGSGAASTATSPTLQTVQSDQPAQSAQVAPGASPQAAGQPVNAAENGMAGAPPLPTWDDVAALTPQSDFSRFVARHVDPRMRNAALKTLFSDPHFNVMDGLDTYIEDYGLPDPLPEGMLRQMNQAHALGLFDHEKVLPEDEVATAVPQPLPTVDDTAAAPGSTSALDEIDTADAPDANPESAANAKNLESEADPQTASATPLETLLETPLDAPHQGHRMHL